MLHSLDSHSMKYIYTQHLSWEVKHLPKNSYTNLNTNSQIVKIMHLEEILFYYYIYILYL